MVYNIIEYRCLFYPKLSNSTVLRMIHKGQLPENHKAIMGRKIMIEIKGFDDGLTDYFYASVEFNNRKTKLTDMTVYELAAELSVKYNLSATKFFKFHGL